ncbi:TRPC2 protein, partial [Nyctibius grandis]|nr:TRPC2 protein [Nyctibius grandis]
QDPKYPVENLLREDDLRPWLGCPRDRSRQLRVELQLERASAIGYLDVGTWPPPWGEVGMGRWGAVPGWWSPLCTPPAAGRSCPPVAVPDHAGCPPPHPTADFLALAAGQKWDRLRLTLSQPFSRHSQFGLSFVRVRTPLDPQQPPPRGPVARPVADDLSVSRSSREEEQLKSRLQQLEPGAGSPARLSRPARMVLSAARSRALRARAGMGGPGGDPELLDEDSGGSVVPGEPELPGGTSRCREPLSNPPHRYRLGESGWKVPGGKGPGGVGTSRGAMGAPSSAWGQPCHLPFPTGRFSPDLLPVHAARCGEEDPAEAWPSSPKAWVSCPICQLPFGAAEVERHASTCGE